MMHDPHRHADYYAEACQREAEALPLQPVDDAGSMAVAGFAVVGMTALLVGIVLGWCLHTGWEGLL